METNTINNLMCQKSKLKSQQVKTPPTNKFRLKLNQANKFN